MVDHRTPITVRTPWVKELSPRHQPWFVAQQLAHLPHLLFLDSAENTSERGRYSYVMANPSQWWSGTADDGVDPFGCVKPILNQRRTQLLPGLPPFQGGVAGLWGYGLHRSLETIKSQQHDDLPTPDYALGFYDWVIAFDHHAHKNYLFVDPTRDAERTATKVLHWLDSPPSQPRKVTTAKPIHPAVPCYPMPHYAEVFSNFDVVGYQRAVARAVDYIHAGDCFQINLSQRLTTRLKTTTLELYERLRTVSPAPFAAYFDLGECQLLSSSPERFLYIDDQGQMMTRPIKGTRPRGVTPEQDASLIHDLMTNPKDRAENVMIVDLLRNDLGRSAEFGTVCVPKVCVLESFSQVHHLVSEVRGRLKADLSPLDALRAAFPGGSITGAPKVRAMELIAELEPTVRGPYCGSLGYVSTNGSMDTNILIRTMTVQQGWVQFPVGGGIVADSDPQREYEETLHKAAGMLKALPT